MRFSRLGMSGRLGLPAAALAFVLVAFSSVAEPTDMPASNPPPPLSKQTFTLVQQNGVDAKPNTAFDIDQTVTLKKGQMLVLKASSGQMIEVAGPYHGKPLDHYTAFPPNGTMGYDPKSFAGHAHCTETASGPHPSGGPNPDETAGSENSASHCH